MTTDSSSDVAARGLSRAPTWAPPDLSRRAIFVAPFRYATLADCFSGQVGQGLLGWLDSDAPWTAKRTDFYEQYEFSCWDDTSPAASYLTSSTVLDAVRNALTELFGRGFTARTSVVCHKLVQGHRIGIHNDYLAGEETHRLTIQLNRGLTDDDGGFLMLFNSEDPADVHRILRPTHGSALAFEISPHSFHAVSEMHAGERYTLIYSLQAT